MVNPAALGDKLKMLNPMTMEAIAAAAVAGGIAPGSELTALIETLYDEARDPGMLTSLPRVVQCWARKPAAGI